jgi:hypothetical protein
MIMPDHAPQIDGDANQAQAFAFAVHLGADSEAEPRALSGGGRPKQQPPTAARNIPASAAEIRLAGRRPPAKDYSGVR